MSKKTNRVIEIFKEMSEIYGTIGDKIRQLAYLKAIQSVKNNSPIEKHLHILESLPNIGRKLADKIRTITETDDLPKLHELQNLPKYKAYKSLQIIPNFGKSKIENLINIHDATTPDKILKLYKNKKITLTKAQIIGLKYFRETSQRIPYEEITKISKYMKSELKKINPKATIISTGSYRRKAKDSKDIDFILVTSLCKKDLTKLINHLKKKEIILETYTHGTNKFSGIIRTRYSPIAHHMDILCTTKDDYIPSLIHFTGSKTFNILMRKRAKDLNCKFSEKGLFCNGKKIKVTSEEDVFKHLKIKYIPPHKR